MKMLHVLIAFILLPLTAGAHPGKTDRDGGHKCYKECADWDLYYAEYHLHDKDGKPVKVARKRPVRSKPQAAPTVEKAVPVEQPAEKPVEEASSQPVVVAVAAGIEPDNLLLSWILLLLFLLLFLAVRSSRRKGASDTGSDK